MRISAFIHRKSLLSVMRTAMAAVFLSVAVLAACPLSRASEKEDHTGLGEIKTPVFTVYYEPDVNLKKVYRKIHRRRFHVSGMKPKAVSTYPEKIAHRMSMLLARVQETLDMYPARVNFKVLIYKDRRSVHNKFRAITKNPQRVKSFYSHARRTIYISETDISDSVLAHEMGHVIIDNYFMVRPPAKVAEMLAIHADSSLDE